MGASAVAFSNNGGRPRQYPAGSQQRIRRQRAVRIFEEFTCLLCGRTCPSPRTHGVGEEDRDRSHSPLVVRERIDVRVVDRRHQ